MDSSKSNNNKTNMTVLRMHAKLYIFMNDKR